MWNIAETSSMPEPMKQNNVVKELEDFKRGNREYEGNKRKKELACGDLEKFVESNAHYLPRGMRSLFYSIKQIRTERDEEEAKSHLKDYSRQTEKL